MFRLLLVVAVTVCIASLGYSYLGDTGRDETSLAEIQSTTQKLEANWEKLRLFRTRLNQTLIELTDEEVTLAEAIDRVLEAGRLYHPVYLQSLPAASDDVTIQERIGHNLVGHLTDEMAEREDNRENGNRVLGRLKQELATMFPDRKG